MQMLLCEAERLIILTIVILLSVYHIKAYW